MKNHRKSFMPLFLAVALVVGIGIGTFYANHFSGNKLGIINTSSNKLNAALRIIEDQYVDTVDVSQIVEDAMPKILASLDPHSAYIPASEVETANMDLKGSFGGVGIQFSILDDTIRVNDVVKGGPSATVGIMPGDRIVSINDTTFVGKVVTNDGARKRLMGEIGTKVKLGIVRSREKDILHFTVTRGNIPVKSIDAYYMIDNFGYIRIMKFSQTTYPELLVALASLNQQDCKGIILDLRGNTGGYMETAVQLVNEFLPKNKLIVYMEGRKQPRKDFRSNGAGSSQTIPLVVLVNEGSASSSEILAGAIQDNDRGLIIGRRTFGKGLVQQPVEFSDGSQIRLTIARYYTPSGRCIQKPYTKGDDESYQMDLINRFEHGEFFSADSIKQNTKEIYHTALGRTVYGGGGIMPDIFVPEDTTGYTSYFRESANSGLIFRFAFEYVDKNREKLNTYTTIDKLADYLNKQDLVNKYATWAEKKGLKRRNILIAKSHNLLKSSLTGNIIDGVLGNEKAIEYFNRNDETIEKAIDVLKKGEATPLSPTIRKSK